MDDNIAGKYFEETNSDEFNSEFESMYFRMLSFEDQFKEYIRTQNNNQESKTENAKKIFEDYFYNKKQLTDEEKKEFFALYDNDSEFRSRINELIDKSNNNRDISIKVNKRFNLKPLMQFAALVFFVVAISVYLHFYTDSFKTDVNVADKGKDTAIIYIKDKKTFDSLHEINLQTENQNKKLFAQNQDLIRKLDSSKYVSNNQSMEFQLYKDSLKTLLQTEKQEQLKYAGLSSKYDSLEQEHFLMKMRNDSLKIIADLGVLDITDSTEQQELALYVASHREKAFKRPINWRYGNSRSKNWGIIKSPRDSAVFLKTDTITIAWKYDPDIKEIEIKRANPKKKLAPFYVMGDSVLSIPAPAEYGIYQIKLKYSDFKKPQTSCFFIEHLRKVVNKQVEHMRSIASPKSRIH